MISKLNWKYLKSDIMRKKCFGNLDGDKVIITDNNSKSLLVQRQFGELHNKYLVLDLFEALYLAENNTLEIKNNSKKLNAEKLIDFVLKKDQKKYFLHRYEVYSEIRSKGYIVKTGLKFGFDFRVYPKGKKIDNAHTQFVVDVLPENEKLVSQKIAKSVRMAQGLNTNLVIAIVDNELDINFYEITRMKF
jgi:tRNA-intron endonuclease